MMKGINYNISLPELQTLSDKELYQIFMYADRDKDNIFRAACTYWMCVMEINRKNHDIEPDCLEVKCLSNIFDSVHEVIFRLGNKYIMCAVDETMVVYDNKWVPYIFSIIEEDSRCVWKYFGVWGNDEIRYVN